MGLNLNGWDMHDVNEAMRDKTLFEIIGMYKGKDEELADKSSEYLQALKDENKVAVKRIEEECEKIDREKCVIALRIADEMSKESDK